MYSSLKDQQEFKLNKINEVKDYFIAGIKARGLMSGGISIASFPTVIGAPVDIVSASFSLVFSITKRIIKKIVKNNTK